MISQMTPAGFSPARREISTAASVWPARTSTPPSRASSGKMWPGLTISLARTCGLAATATVCARSAAEMPVVMPSRASIDTVKAVEWRLALCRAIGGRPSRATCAESSARQISPRPCLAMKLIAAASANSAGDDEVALVLAVLVVDEDEHAPGLRLRENVLDAGKPAHATSISRAT